MLVSICTNCGQGTSLLTINEGLWRCSYCQMRQLRSANPLPLTLLHVINCGPSDRTSNVERAIHQLLGAYRLQGEWFEIPKGLLEKLCRLRGDNLHYLFKLISE